MIATFPTLNTLENRVENDYYIRANYYFPKFTYRRDGDLIQSRKNNFLHYLSKMNDEVITTIPKKLVSIRQSIEYSKFILDLEEGWDGEDALPISKCLYDKTINYLIKIGEFIDKYYNVEIIGPNINPCRDGSIDLEWKSGLVHLLISIQDDGNELEVHYYGIDLNTNNSIKGIKKSLEINEDLAFWMKKIV
jgi:hypothetical protein